MQVMYLTDSLHLSDKTASAAAVASVEILSEERVHHPQPQNQNIQ